jgi:uncharacterized membrane protein
MDLTIADDRFFLGVLLVIILFIFFLVVREIRLMRTGTRKLELELEREKIDLIREDLKPRDLPFTRLSPEQLNPLKEIDAENTVLETDIYAKAKMVEIRLKRLEHYVNRAKLQKMIAKIENEEKKVK